MGIGSFPGVKCGRGVLLTTHPLLVPRSWKCIAIPLPTLWATPGLEREHFTLFIIICAVGWNKFSTDNIGWRERITNKMQVIRFLLSNFYLNMFRASLCPSSGKQDRVLLHMAFCTGCTGCGCVELGAICEGYCSTDLHTVHPAPHNHSQHNQCRTPYAVVHSLALLMMGIMMPETCWDISVIINIGLVASCWFLSLHPTFMMHGHKNLKVTDNMCNVTFW